MPYNPTFNLYYGNKKFTPIPFITIEPELLYVNDIVIGYNYNITLQGYATALNLETYSGGPLVFKDTITSITGIREIFDNNGLTLKGTDGTGDVIVASGGLLQSLNFEQTENNWFNYAKYTAQLSFDSLYLSDCQNIQIQTCGLLPSGIHLNNSPYLIDMQKHKVKSVNDNWTIDASNIHANFSGFPNSYLDITYTVQAVGKHFMHATSGFIPAWQQAKSYCMDRIDQEVSRLKDLNFAPLLQTNHQLCSTTTTTSLDLSKDQTASLLYLLSSQSGRYKIYNEIIDFQISESDGSFDATYKAILKDTYSQHTILNNKHCFHRITRTRSVSDDGAKRVVTENIQGEIEGLIENTFGSASFLSIPGESGYLIKPNDLSNNYIKYYNALDAYNNIVDIDAVGRKLKHPFVTGVLNLRNIDLDPLSPNPNNAPKRNSHNVIHNYDTGTILYTEEYSNENIVANSGVTISSFNISIEDAVPLTAEFIVPGKRSGPIIQKFSAKKSKIINVSIDGTISNRQCDMFDILMNTNICETGLSIVHSAIGIPLSGLSPHEITNNSTNLNTADGSFTINRSYTWIGDT